MRQSTSMIGVELMITGISLAMLMWMIGGYIPSGGTEACVLNWIGPGLFVLGLIVIVYGLKRPSDDDY
jgi:formate-dependent nitrite reductase membrane component NrfD